MTFHGDSKLPDVGTTIFTVMSQLAAETGAINLSQGYPSFDPPQELIDRVYYHMNHGANQYAPMPGVASLRQAIADKTQRRQARDIDADREITICTGATEGLFSAIQAVVHAGDEVIVFDPAYDSYEPAVTLAGGRTVHLPLRSADDAQKGAIDWAAFEQALTARTRLVILNFPHNPTGATLTADDFDTLAGVLRRSNALLLADEVYEHIVFDGAQHISLLRHDELWPRSLVVSSFGKTLHATGWKVGYCIAPAALTTEFRKVHQFTTFTVNTPVQHGLADFLRAFPEHCDGLAGFYQKKRDLFCKLLSASRFRYTPTGSTFFQIVDYSAICDDDDVSLAARWTHEAGVASIPVSVFNRRHDGRRQLRLCFAKDDATLEEAASRLSAL